MLEMTIAPWIALLVLGALHGINPGMGWLFAVALGLQEGSGRAVWRALPPLLAGHLAAIGVALGAGALLGRLIGPDPFRWTVAVALVGLGLYQLRRRRHPRFGGMRVGARELAIWSFLMATAHGAGLMALPFVPGAAEGASHHVHAGAVAGGSGQVTPVTTALAPVTTPAELTLSSRVRSTPALTPQSPLARGFAATALHTLGYLLMTGLIAVTVYYFLGLRMLQRMWLNVDQIWAGSLIVTGLIVLTV